MESAVDAYMRDFGVTDRERASLGVALLQALYETEDRRIDCGLVKPVDDLSELRREADAQDAELVEVYVLWHGHGPDADIDECVCAQYATDHRSDYVFGASAED